MTNTSSTPTPEQSDLAKVQADETQLAADTAQAVKDAAGTVTPPPPVNTPLAMGTVANQTVTVGTPVNIPLSATGGTPPYTGYTVAGLTGGLSITGSVSAGFAVTGSPLANPASDTADTNVMTYTVTDSTGATATGPQVTFTVSTGTVTPPPPPPVTGTNPTINSGQTQGLTIPSNLLCNAVFNSTTLPPEFSEGWYNATTAFQNNTTMIPANVVPTVNGCELNVNSAGQGGIITSDPSSSAGNKGFLFVINKPTLVEFGFVPQWNGSTPANWQEIWYTSINDWLIETDNGESLGGGWFSHVHDNNNADMDGGKGIAYNLIQGQTNVLTSLHLPTGGTRYFWVNGVYVGTLATGYNNTTIQNMLVMGNSVGEGAPLTPGTLLAKYARVWQ